MTDLNPGYARRKQAGALLLPVFVVLGLVVAPAPAQDLPPGDESTQVPPVSDDRDEPANPRLESPRSRLHDPYDDQVLMGGYAALGGGLSSEWQTGRIGYGGVVVFRPGRAAGFWGPLYDWNAGCVLQVDYQKLNSTDDMVSGDGIVRRYFGDRGTEDTEVMIFVGAGVGVTRFSVPGTGGEEQDEYFSAVFEVGQEWLVDHRGYFFVKGQFRYHLQQGRNFQVWSVQAGAGIPWLW